MRILLVNILLIRNFISYILLIGLIRWHDLVCFVVLGLFISLAWFQRSVFLRDVLSIICSILIFTIFISYILYLVLIILTCLLIFFASILWIRIVM